MNILKKIQSAVKHCYAGTDWFDNQKYQEAAINRIINAMTNVELITFLEDALERELSDENR